MAINELESMRWFSHRSRTGGRRNCITYLLWRMWWPSPLPRLPRPHPFLD